MKSETFALNHFVAFVLLPFSQLWCSLLWLAYLTTGLEETVTGWPTCIEKGSNPSKYGAAHCLIDASNMQSRAETKDYGGYNFTVSKKRVGGDPAAEVGGIRRCVYQVFAQR